VVEDVQKAAEGRIVGVAEPVPDIFGEMPGQGAVRYQQPEETDLQARRPTVRTGLEAGDGRGGKGGSRFLSQPHRVVRRLGRTAQAGLVGIEILQLPQRLEEIEPKGHLPEGREQIYRICLRPMVAGHRIISPRFVLRTVSVKELIAA